MQWRCRHRNAVLCLLLAASGAHDAAPPPTPTPAIESVMRVWSTPFVSTRLQNHQDLQVLVQLVRALQKVDPGVQKSNKKAATAWHSQELLEPGFVREMMAVAAMPPETVAATLKVVAGTVKLIERAAARMMGRAGSAKYGKIFVQGMWALANNAGDYNIAHSHPNAVLSGVLHLDAGESDAGRIVFHDPRPIVSCSGAAQDWKKKLFFLCTWCKEPTCPSGQADVAWQTTPALLDRAGVSCSEPPQPGRLQLWPAWVPHEVLPHQGPRARLALAFNVWISPTVQKLQTTLSAAKAKEQSTRVASFIRESTLAPAGADDGVGAGAGKAKASVRRLKHGPLKSVDRWATPVSEMQMLNVQLHPHNSAKVNVLVFAGNQNQSQKQPLIMNGGDEPAHAAQDNAALTTPRQGQHPGGGGDSSSSIGADDCNSSIGGSNKSARRWRDHGGRGDCFFRAFAAQIKDLGRDASRHAEARTQTLHRLRTDETLQAVGVAPFLPIKLYTAVGGVTVVSTLPRYLDVMGTVGTYIEGEAEIKAASDAFDVVVHIYTDDDRVLATYTPSRLVGAPGEATDGGGGAVGETTGPGASSSSSSRELPAVHLQWQQRIEHYVEWIPQSALSASSTPSSSNIGAECVQNSNDGIGAGGQQQTEDATARRRRRDGGGVGWGPNEWLRTWLRDAVAEFVNKAADANADAGAGASTTTKDDIVLWGTEIPADGSKGSPPGLAARPFPQPPPLHPVCTDDDGSDCDNRPNRPNTEKPMVAGMLVLAVDRSRGP